MAFGLQVADHGLDGGAASKFALNDPEDAAFLARDEDAARILGAVAAVPLVDISALDRASGECLGVLDNVPQGVTVVRIIRQRLGVQHELAAGSGPVVGDDRDLHSELVRRGCLAFADALHLGGMEGIKLPAALALLLRADLGGAPERKRERLLERGLTFDLAADVADDPAQPATQDTQLPLMPLELLGVGVAPRHHRSIPGDAQIGLPQSDPVLPRQAVQAPDRRMQQLGVGREADGLGLHRGIHRHPLKLARAQRAGLMRHPQALGQQPFQPVAETLPPMAEVAPLVREPMLEELFAGKILEIRIVDPALAYPLIGQPINVLEQQKPDHEAGLDARSAVLAVERGDLAVDPVPIDPAGELNQLVLQIDDLVEPGSEQIVRTCRLVLLRPHRPPSDRERESCFAP